MKEKTKIEHQIIQEFNKLQLSLDIDILTPDNEKYKKEFISQITWKHKKYTTPAVEIAVFDAIEKTLKSIRILNKKYSSNEVFLFELEKLRVYISKVVYPNFQGDNINYTFKPIEEQIKKYKELLLQGIEKILSANKKLDIPEATYAGATKNRKTKIHAFAYCYLHESGEIKPIFENDPIGKVKAMAKAAKLHKISFKNFQKNYKEIWNRPQNRINKSQIPTIKGAIELLKTWGNKKSELFADGELLKCQKLT